MNKFFLYIVVFLLSILQNLASGQELSRGERIYLCTDRDVYIAGEELFFKCNRFDAFGQKPMESSRYAYIVLRNESNNVVQGICLKFEQDMFSGSIYLPDTLSTGHYQLVSYTNYMRNFGENTFFTKEILIANRFDKDLFKLYSNSNQSDSLSIVNNIALSDKEKNIFSVTLGKDTYKRNEKVKVTLEAIGIKDDEIAKLSVSVHEKTQTQNITLPNINVKLPDTISSCTYLPEIKGIILEGEVFKPGGKQSIIRDLINSNANRISDEETPGLTPMAVAEIVFGLSVNMSQNFYNGSVGNELRGKSFGIHVYGGIGKYIALIAKGFGMDVYAYDPFSSEEIMKKDGVKPLKSADELYSKCQYISVHLPATWETKGSINLNLLSKMPEGAILINTASNGIIDESDLDKMFEDRKDFRYVTTVAPDNANYLTESYPGRFFCTSTKVGEQTEIANINDVLANFRQNHMVFLSTPDTVANLQFLKTNSSGKFSFLLSDYYNNKDLILTLPGNLNGLLKLVSKYELKSSFKPSLMFSDSLLREYLHKSQNLVHIQKSYKVDTGMVYFVNPILGGTTPRVYSSVSNKVYPADFVNLPDFGEISREILPFLRIRKHDDRYEAKLLNLDNSLFFKKEPIIFLDGVPIQSIDQVMNLGSEKIKKIETLGIERYYGGLYFQGILSIFSKNLEINNISFKSSSLRIKYMQLQPASFLKENKYSKLDRTPDFRQLLYWDPSLSIKAKERKTIEFFASDNKGEFEVTVEGITNQGKLINARTTFIINKYKL